MIIALVIVCGSAMPMVRYNDLSDIVIHSAGAGSYHNIDVLGSSSAGKPGCANSSKN
jgi:hypothetical protein